MRGWKLNHHTYHNEWRSWGGRSIPSLHPPSTVFTLVHSICQVAKCAGKISGEERSENRQKDNVPTWNKCQSLERTKPTIQEHRGVYYLRIRLRFTPTPDRTPIIIIPNVLNETMSNNGSCHVCESPLALVHMKRQDTSKQFATQWITISNIKYRAAIAMPWDTILSSTWWITRSICEEDTFIAVMAINVPRLLAPTFTHTHIPFT